MQKEKTRYSDLELEQFRALIAKKLNIAQEKLASYRLQISELNVEHKIKSLDDYVDSYEADHLSEMASREEKYIMHLENALVRIKNKVYGICRQTGKLIAPERLMAVPHATLSMEAKMGKAS